MKIRSKNHETENYSWGVIQDMIEKEISSAFKIRDEPVAQMPTKKELGISDFKAGFGGRTRMFLDLKLDHSKKINDA